VPGRREAAVAASRPGSFRGPPLAMIQTQAKLADFSEIPEELEI
jgi:hypothetical protein